MDPTARRVRDGRARARWDCEPAGSAPGRRPRTPKKQKQNEKTKTFLPTRGLRFPSRLGRCDAVDVRIHTHRVFYVVIDAVIVLYV